MFLLRLVVLVAAATSVAFAATQTQDATSCLNKADGKMRSLHDYSSYSSGSGIAPYRMCVEGFNDDVSYVGARVKCEWDCSTDDRYVQGEEVTYGDVQMSSSSYKSDLDSDILFAVAGCVEYDPNANAGSSADTPVPYYNEQPLKGECSKRVGYNSDGAREESGGAIGGMGFMTICVKHPDHGKPGDDDNECEMKCSKAQCTVQFEFYDVLTDGQQAGAIIGLILWLACIYVIPLWARKRDPNASKFGFGLLGCCCGFLGFLFVPCCTTVKDRSDEQGKATREGTEMSTVTV